MISPGIGPAGIALVAQPCCASPLPIRSFEPGHFDAALALWQRTPGVGLSASDEQPAIERFLRRNPGLSFVAMDGEQLVGTVLVGHDGRRGLIHHLVVDTGHRRRGLARALLDTGLSALRLQGVDRAHLLVFRTNADGLAFWRRVAMERTEIALFSVETG